MFSKEEYQECLETLLRFAHESPNVKWTLIHERIRLENLIETYPEYLELKAKTTPIKPEEVERNVYRCLSCEKIIIPIGERKIWHKHFTPCCPNCGRLQDWGEDE